MQIKRTHVVLTLLALCCLGALWGGFFLPSDTQRGVWFEHTGFYFIFASFALWAASLMRLAPKARVLWQKLRVHWAALALALVLCVSAFLLSPPKIRVLYDEPNLIGVGMNFYYDHLASIPKNAIFLHGVKTSLLNQLDKRPLAYPFLLYTAHVLTGYSGYNGFIINFLAAFGALFVWYVLLRRWFPQWMAFAGMVLLAAYPLFVIYATSSGFEIVNLLFILLAFHFFNCFLDQRTAPQAERLLLTLVILAQCRYESALFLGIFALLILWLLPRTEYARISPLTLAVPLLLLPVAWQTLHFTAPEYHEIDNGQAIFGVNYLIRNLHSALISMLGFIPKYAMLTPVFFLACAGCCLGVYRLFRLRIRKRPELFYPLLAFLISYVAVTILQFSYHLAILTVTTTARLGIIYLPVLIFFALLALQGLTTLLQRCKPALQAPKYILLGCCALLLFSWPVAGIDEGVNWLLYYRRYDAIMHYLEKNYPRHNALVIDERSHPYTIHRYSAANYFFARDNLPLLLSRLQQHFFQDILLMQNIDLDSEKPYDDYQLDPQLPLQTLYQEQLNPRSYLRISRIVPPQEQKENGAAE